MTVPETALDETGVLARAYELAETDEYAEMVIEIIARARSSGVDREVLQRGLGDSVTALGDDAERALRGQYKESLGQFGTDREMFHAIQEAEDQLVLLQHEITKCFDQAETLLIRARRDYERGQEALCQAEVMRTEVPCDGCHGARQRAIDDAQQMIGDAQNRIELMNEAISVLRGIPVAYALAGLGQVPDDYVDYYELIMIFVAKHGVSAMPTETTFISGFLTGFDPRPQITGPARLITAVLRLAHGRADDHAAEAVHRVQA